MFDALAEVIAQTGIPRGHRKRCVDSTVFADAVTTQDTVTQLKLPGNSSRRCSARNANTLLDSAQRRFLPA